MPARRRGQAGAMRGCTASFVATLVERSGGVQNGSVRTYRLQCSEFCVEARTREFNGRWLASADTPHGPTLGVGRSEFEALWAALEPFAPVVDQLLASLSRE